MEDYRKRSSGSCLCLYVPVAQRHTQRHTGTPVSGENRISQISTRVPICTSSRLHTEFRSSVTLQSRKLQAHQAWAEDRFSQLIWCLTALGNCHGLAQCTQVHQALVQSQISATRRPVVLLRCFCLLRPYFDLRMKIFIPCSHAPMLSRYTSRSTDLLHHALPPCPTKVKYRKE
jgi:hypothetical protein